ncbi:MAG TPA: FkbM family methyltransferase [Taishania sp.]|nr:FkbM family methyltransferase [Taishania sp.]
MKNTIYKIAYSPAVNCLLRNTLKPISKVLNKRLISVSGQICLKVKNAHFKLKTNQTCSATQELFYNGAENYEFTKLFIPLIQKVDNFLDIGANIGYFSVLGAKLNKDLKVYAFEPSIGPLYYLKQNIELNHLQKQVNVIGKAVSDIDGILTFHSVVSKKYPWVVHNLNGSHSLQNNFGKQKEQAYPVEVISLSKFKEEYQLNKIDFIKLDTECTEHLIFKSSLDIINADRPIIVSEIYDEIKHEIEPIFKQMNNYCLFQINQNQLFPMDSILDQVKFKGEANFLFCPEEKLGLFDL